MRFPFLIWTFGCLWLVITSIWVEVCGTVRLVTQTPSPLFEDRQGAFLAESPEQELGYWSVPDDIPPKIRACVLAIEDHRFEFHRGVDVRALVRAFLNNMSGGPRQGGSTLAMQVARMQHPGPRTHWRKVAEIVTARLLVARYGRQAVLRQYLRIVPQGNRIHGVAYAARRYFQKPLEDLGWAEAALLAGLAKAPGRFNPYQTRGCIEARARARLVLARVCDLGWMGESDYRASLAALDRLDIPSKESRPFYATHAILRLQSERVVGAEMHRPIRTTLDLNLQEQVDDLAHRAIERVRPLGMGNVAVIVAETQTGNVLSYVGSDFYQDETFSGAINYARTPRSSGSAVKPFIYAFGLESGKFAPNSILADLPLHLTHPSGQYSVDNFDASFLGPLLVRRALATSRNIPAVGVVRTVGLDRVYAYLKDLGLADPAGDPDYYGLGLAIGGLYVTLEELVTAYGVLANAGQSFSLNFVPCAEEPGSKRQIMDADVARLVTLFLSDPAARLPVFPRGGPLEFPFPVAVKTGTSQGFRDAWCIAFSRKYVVGAWMGHPDFERTNHVSGAAAARLVKQVMTLLHPAQSRGVDVATFPPPEGYRPGRLCPVSGQWATSDCPAVALEYLKPDAFPSRPCGVHQVLEVDGRTGRLADAQTPDERREKRLFVALDPRYAVWCTRHGWDPPPPSTPLVPRALVSIQAPQNDSRLLLDSETPRRFQSLALRAEVTPNVPEITWYVDGVRYQSVPYPYATRWPLTPGRHTFQVRFPRAAVMSEIVSIQVMP